MKDAVLAKADNRASLRISRARDANNFTTNPIIFRDKSDGSKGGRADVGICGKQGVGQGDNC
jgi:hypothetical protein